MIKKFPIILLNFTGIYDYESFASGHNITHVDCRNINGVDCYCDEEGRRKLHSLLAPYPAQALHFIDSGDYHYLTEYWVSKLQEPFTLIVFDHHPDMQQPQWEGVVSCGGWVTDVLEKNPFVKKHHYRRCFRRAYITSACSSKRKGDVLQSSGNRPSPGMAFKGGQTDT